MIDSPPADAQGSPAHAPSRKAAAWILAISSASTAASTRPRNEPPRRSRPTASPNSGGPWASRRSNWQRWSASPNRRSPSSSTARSACHSKPSRSIIHQLGGEIEITAVLRRSPSPHRHLISRAPRARSRGQHRAEPDTHQSYHQLLYQDIRPFPLVRPLPAGALCKQGVVGSIPISSTAFSLVTASHSWTPRIPGAKCARVAKGDTGQQGAERAHRNRRRDARTR